MDNHERYLALESIRLAVRGDMYKYHGWARSPRNEHTPIVRYFRLERFLDLLSAQSLYFARLSQFEDAFDGVLPDGTKPLEKDHFTNLPRNEGDEFTDFEMLLRSSNRINKYCTYASCWYENPYESDAMWKLYGRMGVALQSDFAGLRDSFSPAREDVHIGQMTYFDYATSQPPTYGNTLAPAFYKRIEFEHERELRAVVVHTPKTWSHGELTDELIAQQPLGLRIPVDLTRLIQGIVLAPGANPSAHSELEQQLKAAGIDVPVRFSNLDSRPRLI